MLMFIYYMLFDAVIWVCNTKIMTISDISLVFLNYSLVIGLHTCLFMFDKRTDINQSAQKDAHCGGIITFMPFMIIVALARVVGSLLFNSDNNWLIYSEFIIITKECVITSVAHKCLTYYNDNMAVRKISTKRQNSVR